MEGHPYAAERHGLAVTDRLGRGGEVFSVSQAHQIERLLGGKHRAVAGARVVGMAVCDERFVHRARGVDIKAADLAAEAGGGPQENIVGAHGLEISWKWRNRSWSRHGGR